MENHDDFIIVWLDSSMDVPKKLENMTDFLQKYNSVEECENYIETIRTERKILLVLVDFHIYVSYFNQYSQVQSIYILNKSFQVIDYDKEQCSKLVHVFHDEYTLSERLRQDIIFTYRYDLPINICSIREITNDQSILKLENNRLFYWNQTVLYYLVDTSNVDMNELKTSMVKQCRLEYQNNESELRKINEFAQYCTSDNILEWYSRDSFVYRLVNKAFRSRNLDLICKFRYAIILLYEKLKDLSIQQQKRNFTTVYRAQCMKKNELELLKGNKGQLISTNTLMSTTLNRNIAEIYHNQAEMSVMFEINIETGNNLIYPFADISELSHFSEDEVLFFAGAVFRINSVEIEVDLRYTVKLTLSNEKLKLIEQLTNTFKAITSLDTEHCNIFSLIDDICSFKKYHLYLTKRKFSRDEVIDWIIRLSSNNLLYHGNNTTTIIDYYKQLLFDESFLNIPRRIIVNMIIGKNYFRLKQYDDAFIYYGLAFSLLDDQNRLTSEIYHLLGDIWREINQDETALSCYKEALNILEKHDNKDKNLIKLFTKISEIHSSQNHKDDAKNYDSQANEILEYHKKNPKYIDMNIIMKHLILYNIKLDPQFLERAYNLYVNGMHILAEKEFSQGLEYLKQAEKMFEKQYFQYDLKRTLMLTIIYEHQALAYLGLKDYFNATIAWKKAIDFRMIHKF